MQQKRNSDRKKEKNHNKCCSSLFSRRKQKQHSEKMNETLSKSSTNRSKNDITKNSCKESQSGKRDSNNELSQNATKIINKQPNCLNDIAPDKTPDHAASQLDNKNETPVQPDKTTNNNNEGSNGNSNMNIHISFKNPTEYENDESYNKETAKVKDETNINDNNNNNTPSIKRGIVNEEENVFRSKQQDSHLFHDNHPHSTCEIKSIKTNSNNINSIGHKKANTNPCEGLNKDKQSNYSSNNKSAKHNVQSSFYNQQQQQQQQQLQQQLQQITLNNKQLNHSCINNNKSSNINQFIPTNYSKQLYNSTALGINGERHTYNPQDILSKNVNNSSINSKHITSNNPTSTHPKHESNNSSINNTELKTTHKEPSTVQLNYLTNSPTQSIKKILQDTDTEEIYNLTDGEDERSVKANPNELENSTYNDNVSLISSHVLGTKSMADINDRLSVCSRSIYGSRMFPTDNESILYDLEQRQTQTQVIQEKINQSDIAIKKYTEKIDKLKEQILHCEELTKNYLRFIEKEERISDELRIMINYLHLHRENNKL